jgi:molybdate transport system ATP-binding protein
MLELDLSLRRGAFTLQAAFRAPTPGITALFGRSGSGKSTLIDLVAGLLRPDTGRVALDGQVLVDTTAGVQVPAERRRIGYVFQDARLFPHLRVSSNLDYGARRAPRAVGPAWDDVVELLGLGALLSHRPHQLSGGERQRVAIGRALLQRPQLLLLDEPLASLDQARREELLPWLEQLRDHARVPMLYVSHQYDEVVRLATHVIVLESGAVAAAGDLATVSLAPALRSIVGPDGIGAVLEGTILDVAAAGGLATLALGGGALKVAGHRLVAGQRARVHLLARDLILATVRPEHLSVRNALSGHIAAITPDDAEAELVRVDVGGSTLVARVSREAVAALGLVPGKAVWALAKATSLHAHALAGTHG